MKPSSIQLYIFLFMTVLLLLSCEDLAPFQDNEVITGWEYVQDKTDGADTVKITDIQPQGAAAETASVLTIYGENFQPGVENVRVFFNSTEVTVISAGETEIEVYRPKISGDSVIAKVACHDRINVAHSEPIAIAQVVSSFGNFVSAEQIKDFTIDANSNIYAFLAGDVNSLIKFEYPSQSRSIWIGELDAGQPPYGFYTPIELKVDVAGDIAYTANIEVLLRCGADGSHYLNNRVDMLGANTIVAREFDYAFNDDIYVGGINSGIIRVPQSGGVKKFDLYPGFTIKALRVYDGFVYVIAKPQAGTTGTYGVYKNEINPTDGSLGASTMVFDWKSIRNASTYELNDLTFSASGVMFVASGDAHSPLMKYENDALVPVYFDIIPSPINEMEWGTGNYLYVLTKTSASFGSGNKIYKVNLGEPGAPYFGRE